MPFLLQFPSLDSLQEVCHKLKGADFLCYQYCWPCLQKPEVSLVEEQYQNVKYSTLEVVFEEIAALTVHSNVGSWAAQEFSVCRGLKGCSNRLLKPETAHCKYLLPNLADLGWLLWHQHNTAQQPRM